MYLSDILSILEDSMGENTEESIRKEFCRFRFHADLMMSECSDLIMVNLD